MNLLLKSKILGSWENEEIKYLFQENNLMQIEWDKNNIPVPGKYYIDNNQNIDVKYGFDFNMHWSGKINYISSTELSITDLSNEVGKIDVFYRIMPIENSKNSNSNLRYILTRTLTVFLIILFYKWIINIDNQLLIFSNISKYSFFYQPLIGLVGLIIIILGLLLFNSVFSLIKSSKDNNTSPLIQSINKNSLISYIKQSFSKFQTILVQEYKFELREENKMFTPPFLLFALIIIIFIEGSPIVNNYKGIYMNFEEYNSNGETYYKAEPYYVFNKKDTLSINRNVRDLRNSDFIEEEYFEYDDVDYYDSERGYLFEQTAIIEGFKPYGKNYSGFFNYIICLIYFSIEKLIVTIIWFLIPFLTWVGIALYKRKT